MDASALCYLCTKISDLHALPVRLFADEAQLLWRAPAPLPADPMTLHRAALWAVSQPVGCFAAEDLSYYGVVHVGAHRIILGPTRQVPYTRQELHTLAFRLDVPAAQASAFAAGLHTVARMSYQQLVQLLCFVYFVLCGRQLSVTDVSVQAAAQTRLKQQTAADTLQQMELEALPADETALPPANNSIAVEDAIMNIVSHGDAAALQTWAAAMPTVHSGIVAADQLRQMKNLFICTATLTSRAAIRGGLDAGEALALSDSFIQRCEAAADGDSILNLQYHMTVEYTERVARIRHGHDGSRLATAVAGYVRRHLSQSITTQDIADSLFLSRTHLCRKFKAETGQTLSNFILREKTEEAARLLRYTDKTAAAIGAYLGFSSQGHFSRVFTKYTGLSPREYREKHPR